MDERTSSDEVRVKPSRIPCSLLPVPCCLFPLPRTLLSPSVPRPPSAKALLQSKRAPQLALLAAILLALPSVRMPLVLDDLWHRATLQNDTRWIPHAQSPLRLFDFATGDPEAVARMVKSGLAPWWTFPTLRISFLRPLSSLTHVLDYALWPSSTVLMHVHSIAWYAAVVYLASHLYRRWLGPISSLASSIATLFYAIDHNHGMVVGWIAHRNALVATAFALGTLLLHDIATRRPRPGVLPFATASALGLALCGGESAISTAFYLAAHAVFLDTRTPRERLRSLSPSIVVLLGWMVAYRALHFGASGSGMYVDPWHAPLAYATNLVAHVPLLLGAELGAPTPDVYPFLPTFAKVAFVLAAAIVVAWAGRVILWMVQEGDQRLRQTAAFLASASALSVFPPSATFPSGRTLLIAGFGMMGLLGLACSATLENATWARAPWGNKSRPLIRAYAAWSWLGHLLLAPPLFLLSLHSMVMLDRVIHELGAGVPADGSAVGKRLVLVNAPDTALSYYLIGVHLEEGRAPPSRMLIMAGGRRDSRFSRTGERTFVVHEDGGFYRTGTELLFRSVDPPLPIGTTVAFEDLTVWVSHTTEDGVPDEATFVFSKDLDQYVFRKWVGRTLVPCALPSIGQTFTFAGRAPDLF